MQHTALLMQHRSLFSMEYQIIDECVRVRGRESMGKQCKHHMSSSCVDSSVRPSDAQVCLRMEKNLSII